MSDLDPGYGNFVTFLTLQYRAFCYISQNRKFSLWNTLCPQHQGHRCSQIYAEGFWSA